MSFDPVTTLEIIEVMEAYLQRNRPPEHIRSKLDMGYRIENQSIYLFEIRPSWKKPIVYKDWDFAKTTYIKRQEIWKVYWMRGNLEWTIYDPKPQVKKLIDFIRLVEEDAYRCFFG